MLSHLRQMNVTLHWNPGSWLTLLNASQQVNIGEERCQFVRESSGVWNKFNCTGPSLLSGPHGGEGDAKAMKRKGGRERERRWSCEIEQASHNRQEETNTNKSGHSIGEEKTKRDETIFKVLSQKTWSKCNYKTIFNHIMNNEEKGNNDAGV